MNQNEQIIQVLSRALGTFGVLLSLTENKTALHIIKERILDLNGAIDHVEKMQKTEHVEADVSNKARNLDMMQEALLHLQRIKDLSFNAPFDADESSIGLFEEIGAESIAAMLPIEQALAAEPAPLVRLTEEDQVKIVTFFLHCGLDNWQKLWQCSNAIMDAMELKNGGAE